LRSLPDSTDFYDHKDEGDLDLMLAGKCVLAPEVVITPRKDKLGRFEKSLRVVHIPYEECFFDPYARRKDFLDARYFHRVCWVDKERLETLVTDKSALEGVIYNSEPIFTHAPAPDGAYGRKRALIVYSWFREGEKIKYKLWDYSSKTALIEGDSPYRFNRFPIAARALYRDREKLGATHGLFTDIKPIQDSINFKLLRITNLLGTHKLLIESDAVADIGEFVEDYSRDDSVTFVERGAISGGKIKDITNHAAIDKLMQLVIDDRKQAEFVTRGQFLNGAACGIVELQQIQCIAIQSMLDGRILMVAPFCRLYKLNRFFRITVKLFLIEYVILKVQIFLPPPSAKLFWRYIGIDNGGRGHLFILFG
jgi:hypothetical protein